MIKIKIVESLEKYNNETNQYVKDVLSGKIKIDKKRAEKTLVLTPEMFAKLFSPQRMRLILSIKKNNLGNIYQIAKKLDRHYESVYSDIALLEGFGLIKIKKKENKKIPYIDEVIKIPALAG